MGISLAEANEILKTLYRAEPQQAVLGKWDAAESPVEIPADIPPMPFGGGES